MKKSIQTKIIHLQGLKNCMYLMSVYINRKALELTQENKIPVIYKILERYFTEMFHYCFIETFFEVHV